MDSPEKPAVPSAAPAPTSFYRQQLWSFIFPVLEPWAAESGLGLGLLPSKVSLPIFIHHMWIWDHLFGTPCSGSPSTPSSLFGWCGLFVSLVVGLPYSLMLGSSGFCFEVSCDSSCGCVRRQSVSPHATILTGSPTVFFRGPIVVMDILARW